jgi:hypothetical protein
VDEPGIVPLDAVHHTSLSRFTALWFDSRLAACSLPDDVGRLLEVAQNSTGFPLDSEAGLSGAEEHGGDSANQLAGQRSSWLQWHESIGCRETSRLAERERL